MDKIRFTLATKVPTNSKVLILYKALTPDMKDLICRTNFSVGAQSQAVEIKTIKQVDENGISNLPNLF